MNSRINYIEMVFYLISISITAFTWQMLYVDVALRLLKNFQTIFLIINIIIFATIDVYIYLDGLYTESTIGTPQ